MFFAMIVTLVTFPVGLWMAIRPIAVIRQARRLRRPPVNRRYSRPSYFTVNFIRLSGFFITAFSLLLLGEALLRQHLQPAGPQPSHPSDIGKKVSE